MINWIKSFFTPSPPKECRICFTSDKKYGNLVKPCRCSGTIGYVHDQCLLTWHKMSQNEVCGTCGIEFRRKYSMEMVDGEPQVIVSFHTHRWWCD